MNIPITQGLSTFQGIASVLVLSLVGVAAVMVLSGLVKSANIRAACILAIAASGSTLLVLILAGNLLVADEIAWHTLAEEASRFLTGQSNTRVAYVDGKEGYLWIIGALYAFAGPVPMMAILLNIILNALTVVTVARTTEIIVALFPLLEESARRRAVLTAAFVTALVPSLFIWVPRMLREAPSIFLISLAVLGTLLLVQTRQARYAVVSLGAVACLAWIRGPVGMALGLALATGAVLVWSHRSQYRLAIRFFLLIPLLLLIGVAWDIANAQFGLSPEEVALRNRELSSVASSGFSGAEGLSGELSYGTILMVNVPRILAGPFVWEFDLTSPVMLLAFMEGIVWVLCALLSISAVWRRRYFAGDRGGDGALLAIVVFAAGVVLATMAVSVANYGLLARLRPMAFVVLVPLAAIAVALWPEVRAQRAKARRGRLSHTIALAGSESSPWARE